MANKASRGEKRARSKEPARLSRLRKPKNMSLEDWQIGLRRQFASEQSYQVRKLGDDHVFSDYNVTNPQTRRTYRVAIRGDAPGFNYCSCPDYAVNTLGTCKHIEYLLRKLRRRPGTKKVLADGHHPTFSEVFLRYGARRDIIFRPAADCPADLRKLAAACFDGDGVLRLDALSEFSAFLQGIASINDGHEVRCYDDALQFVSSLQDQEEREKRIEKEFPDDEKSRAWERLIKAELYPYQRQGALFAAKAGRCLIADDMGLGKTIEAIAAVEIMARHAEVRRVLVICPTSLKHQWQLEIERFTERSTIVVEGLVTNRRRLYGSDAFFTIVNYDVIHRDLEAIGTAGYDLIILDEAQRIKNWKTRAAKAVKQLDSDYAFVLTGTPLENRLEELHSIVEFVDRHRLGPMFRFLANHQHVDETGRVVGYRNLDFISRTMEGILVRRTKETVLKQLPERLEKHFFVPMTKEQNRHHEENREIVARIVSKWRRYGYLSEIDQRRLTCSLQNMRMSCDSTYLLDGETADGNKIAEATALLEDIFEDGEAKVVVFSQWLRMHELLSREFTRRKWGHVLFHGGVPGRNRKALVSRFRDDPGCRLFLATDAGGVGLNLQNAAAVINMDLPWNPAVLEQRIGRVHRLGQRRPVRVANFVARGTIEEGMLELLAFKKSMFAGVLDGGAKEVFLGGTRLKQFMNTVEKATGGIAAPSADGGGSSSEEKSGAYAAPAEESLPAKQSPPARGPSQGEKAAAKALSPQELGELLTVGASFLKQIGESLQQTSEAATSAAGSNPLSGMIGRDEVTGRNYLRLPLPGDDLLSPLLGLLRRISK